MRLYIKQIIKALNVTEEVAKKIEFQMECSGFDFSEATNEEFAKKAKEAQYELIMTFEETKAESIREMTVRLPQVAAIQRALTN